MPCFAIRAAGQPDYRFGLFGTACIALLSPNSKKPGAISARASDKFSRLRFLTRVALQVNRISDRFGLLQPCDPSNNSQNNVLDFGNATHASKVILQNCELTSARAALRAGYETDCMKTVRTHSP
jgi:hypothetical protein